MRHRLVMLAICMVLTLGPARANESPVHLAIVTGSAHAPARAELLRGFLDAFARAGYTLGDDLFVDTYRAAGDAALRLRTAETIRAARPDLVLGLGAESTRHLDGLDLGNRPVVFIAESVDPVTQNVRHPAHSTGVIVHHPFPETWTVLRSFLPDATRLGLLVSGADPDGERWAERIRRDATDLGLTDIQVLVDDATTHLGQPLRALVQKVDLLLLAPAGLTPRQVSTVAGVAHPAGVPVVASSSGAARSGALCTLHPDMRQSGVAAGKLALRVLDGTDPRHLPLRHERDLECVISTRALTELQLDLPGAVAAIVTGYESDHVRYLDGVFRVEAKNDSLHTLLGELQQLTDLLHRPLTIEQIGTIDSPITATLEERSIGRLLQQLLGGGKGLCVERQGRLQIYGQGAAEILGDEQISYLHYLRGLTSDAAVQQLSAFADQVGIQGIGDDNSLAMLGKLSDIRRTLAHLEVIDREYPVVMIELLVVEFMHGKNYAWGIDLGQGQSKYFSDAAFSPGMEPAAQLTYSVVDMLDTQFTANVRALITDDLARIVTNPHVAVRSGEQATIELTETQKVLLQTIDADVNTSSFDLTDVTAGVHLQVTPHILADGMIHLDLQGDLSVFVTPELNAEFATSENKIDTKVAVEEGSTLIIGGLIKTKSIEGESGIPFLEDLPVLGYVFKQKAIERSQVETVLYVTPHLMPIQGYEELASRSELTRILREVESGSRSMRALID